MYTHGVTDEVIKSEEDSNLVKFAKEQLKPWFESGDDMSVLLANNVLDLVTLFASQNHSGVSATYCESAFMKLIHFEPMKFKGEDEE